MPGLSNPLYLGDFDKSCHAEVIMAHLMPSLHPLSYSRPNLVIDFPLTLLNVLDTVVDEGEHATSQHRTCP